MFGKIKIKKRHFNLITFMGVGLLFFGFLFPSISHAVDDDWEYQMISFYAYPDRESETSPVYRFYNIQQGGYFYTVSKKTRDWVIKTKSDIWDYQGVGFYAYSSRKSGTLPVYKFQNRANSSYYYTISEKTRDWLIETEVKQEDWRYDGIGFYAYSRDNIDNLPIYRYFRRNRNAYYYRTNEKNGMLGPEISVGIWAFDEDYLEDEAFEIDGNKRYVIKDDDGHILGRIDKDDRTKVKYDGGGKLRVYSTINDVVVDEKVYFEAADGDNTTMIFDVHLPGYSYDEYRGKIKLDHSEYTNPNRPYDWQEKIWVVNILPLEHYVWGDGELVGDGDMDHNKVMVTSFRSYGYWWIDVATKWRYIAGFIVNATPGNQLYRGYEYEEDHPRVKKAAEETRGKIVASEDSDEKNHVAITPYSSWTDGRTRSFEERWGGKDYPWCKSVDDPYGDNETSSNSYIRKLTTDQLVNGCIGCMPKTDSNPTGKYNGGNHMVGLSANGSVDRANAGWSWTKILNYYFDDIDIKRVY